MSPQKRLSVFFQTKGPSNNLLKFLVRRVVRRASQQITLADIGELVEDLIGESYVSPYLEPEFESSNEKKNIAFVRPFNDLLIWAVLTVRQGMALCFWQRGEDALAKVLDTFRMFLLRFTFFRAWSPQNYIERVPRRSPNLIRSNESLFPDTSGKN